MHRMSHRARKPRMRDARSLVGLVLAVATAFVAAGVARADTSRAAHMRPQNELWRRTLKLVAQGDFGGATETIGRIDSGDRLTEQVRAWLFEYQTKQASRKELDRADFEKYVGYAKARIERSEYTVALKWLRAAAEAAEEREAFLASGWVDASVRDALAKADALRQEADWRGAWDIYWQLGELYERNEKYRKLEHEVSTHLRLDLMFQKESRWEEHLVRVHWEDAREAFELIERFYVEPTDYKKIAESGLEQLLLLAESKTARETLEGLGDEDDRNDFVARLQAKLDQVRAAPSLDRTGCVRVFRRVFRDINRQTVRLPDELIVSELVRGAFDTLDEFTTVIWPRDGEEFDKRTRGNFIGVGIQIVKNRAQEVEVVTPLDGTPAYRAGIQAGDVIAAVDGVRLEGESLSGVVDIITGPKGTPVTLTIRRNGEDIEFPLVRDLVKIHSVKGTRRNPESEEKWNHWLDEENGIGYVRVTNFQKNTVQDVADVVGKMEAEGLKGLVLDLRSNPGGLLDSAWHLSSLFLMQGDAVVSTRGRIAGENQRFSARVDGPFCDLPLVVLVNESSASASEIVSGAIRDNRRGIVVGARTFGKFSVQNLIPLGHSSAKLKITTAKYYLPNGDSLHREPTSDRWGVEPDVPVRLVRWERANLYQMRREADLLGPPAPKADKKRPAGESHGEKSDTTEVEARAQDEEPHLLDDDLASWFKPPPGMDLAAMEITTAKSDDPSLVDFESLMHVSIGGREVDVVAKDLDGATVSAVNLGIEDRRLVVHARGTDGNEVLVARLFIDGQEAQRSMLPPLEQPDENNRPMEDPQLDTALLLLRVALVGASHPTLAEADANSALDRKASTP